MVSILARHIGGALRILLSFNPDDVALAEAFRASLFVASPELEIFFTPILFEEYRPLDLQHADAFLLLVGPHGLAERQAQECSAAIQLKERSGEFLAVAILAAGAKAPQILPRHLPLIEAPVVTDRDMLRQVVDALAQYDGLAGISGSRKLAN